MHPALSVIFFTTTAGAGYGLLMMLGVLAPIGILPPDRVFGAVALALALALVSTGLFASLFHLSHPERSWRAMLQYRSSWLSREGVAASVTYLPALVFILGWVGVGNTSGTWGLMGVAASFMALVTVLCTAMIYQSLKTIHEWHNSLTLPNYLMLALMSGGVWLSALVHLFGIQAPTVDAYVIAYTAIAWGLKVAYWNHIDTTRHPSTRRTATGIRARGAVRLVDPPHMTDNFLLKEMGFRIARKHALKLRRITHVTAFAVPLVGLVVALVLQGPVAAGGAVVAALSASFGVVLERWLFFAEARHTVMLYYGEGPA